MSTFYYGYSFSEASETGCISCKHKQTGIVDFYYTTRSENKKDLPRRPFDMTHFGPYNHNDYHHIPVEAKNAPVLVSGRPAPNLGIGPVQGIGLGVST